MLQWKDYKQCYSYAWFKVKKEWDKPDVPFWFAYYYKHKLLCHIELVPQEPIANEEKVIKFIPQRRILLTEDHHGAVIIMPIKYIKNAIFKPASDEDIERFNKATQKK